MVWIALAVVIVIGLLWIAKVRGTTVYFSHPNGFSAFSFASRESELVAVSRDRYERILRRFLEGDLFDYLFVSYKQEDDGGIALALKDHGVEMSVSFLTLKEPERIAQFRLRMESAGYVPSDESPWNEGLGEELESITLAYRTEREWDAVRLIVEHALDALEGPSGDQLFVHAWRSQDGPRGNGIQIVSPRDPLRFIP